MFGRLLVEIREGGLQMSEKKEMTKEEAITCLQEKYDFCKSFYDLAAHPEEDYPEMAKYLQALQIALSALRPITREQVEKAWRGEWQMISNGSGVCSECHRQDKIDPLAKFCRYCGARMEEGKL